MKKNNGFTLIEVLVSIAVLGLIITALFNINIAGFKFMNYNQDRVELQRQSRVIMLNLEKQIRSGSDITINLDGDIVLSGDSGDIVKFFVDDSVSPNQLKMDNSGSIRNISDKIIDTHTFNIEDADQGRIYLYFRLVKDNSSYEIHNRFFPRAKN